MKKTLIAAAALSAMTASAMAASVSLSGVVDFGLNFSNVKAGTAAAVNNFTAKSGQNSGSRVCFKGSEKIGKSTVGFHLENGFAIDDGTLTQDGRFFGREARIYAQTPYGTFHFGRMGALDSGLGSATIFGNGSTAAFGTGWGDTIGKESAILPGLSSRYDNSIVYQTPTVGGVTAYLNYSFKTDSTKAYNSATYDDNLAVVAASSSKAEEGRASATRYYAAGLTVAAGNLNVAVVASQQNYAAPAGLANLDDSQALSVGLGYKIGGAKVMLEGQWFDMGVAAKYTGATAAAGTSGKEKGLGLILSGTLPVCGGTMYGSLGYKDSEDTAAANTDYVTYQAALGYTYSFSKLTSAYVAAGYTQAKTKTATTAKTKTTEVAVGLITKF